MRMDYQLFLKWLKEDKNMAGRSAKDVVSRCRRIERITQSESLNYCTESILVESTGYADCSMFIKSQLKRALALYNEYTITEVKDEI